MKLMTMPRCLECKTKFEQYQFNNKFCKAIDCQVAKGLHLLDKGKKQQAKNKQGINKTRSEDKHKNQKNDLKTEIQKLARLIDVRFNLNCCCCNKPIDGTGHGAHYKNKGGNENIMFNLHNIHRSRAHCNTHSSEHKKGYYIEMERRYGIDYRDYLETGLGLIYKEMHFTPPEISKALKTTRGLIKQFDTLQLTNPIIVRDMFNTLIGLYPEPYLV
mgnify:FL=1